MPAPQTSAIGTGIGLDVSATGFQTNRTAAISNIAPTMILNVGSGSVSHPPIKAAGTEASAKGQKMDQEKQPAR